MLQLGLEAEFIGKILTLSDKDKITSKPFLIGKCWWLASIKNCICNFPEVMWSKLFVFNFGLDFLHPTALCIFQDSFAVVVVSSEWGKSSTITFPLMVVMATLSYGHSIFRCKPKLVIWLLLVFLWGLKLSMPKRIHSEIKKDVLEGPFLKKSERGISAM